MKKYMLMLAVALIASPAWAAVTVSVVDNGDFTADITYDVTGEPNKVAAFALDIVVDGGAVITAVSNYHTGVSVAGSEGYGIFPANFDRYITVNTNGDVDDWDPGATGEYNPAAEAGDKGAQGGIGTAGITLEMGALYKGDGNAPPDSGVLCTITVDMACNADLEGNAIRGEVVLEGAGTPASVTYVDGPITGGPADCLAPDHPDYAEWVAMEKPDCWCIQTQCHGDADGLKEGSFITGYFRVHFNDLTTLLAAWNVQEPPKGPGLRGQDERLCADFSRSKEGSFITGEFRVHFQDLTILVNSWNITEPPKGAGIPKDCGGDIDPDTL
jgi:hypothetical protein